MANLNNTSAMNALNEKDYINKLYGNNSSAFQKLMKQNFKDNTSVLNNQQNVTQAQTSQNVNRTQVEAEKLRNAYTTPKLSVGASAQAALTRTNAQQRNTSALQQQQSQADMEIERQRQLLASQYATAIKQAQANNDMLKAQQLYDAAKAEEEKLLAMRQAAGSMMAQKGDKSIQEELLAGKTPTSDYSGKTWDQVLKNEAALNEVYDKQLESEQMQLQLQNQQAMSELDAKRRENQMAADMQMNQAYVDALQKAKNYAEVQTAYGQISGTAAAAQAARDTEFQDSMTKLRSAQMDAETSLGAEGFDLGKAYRQALADKTTSINTERAKKLFEAAEKEEDTLYNTQLQIAQERAKKGDYTILGKMYGLTADQIDRLMGRGKYASKGEDDSTKPKQKPSHPKDERDVLANPEKTRHGTK